MQHERGEGPNPPPFVPSESRDHPELVEGPLVPSESRDRPEQSLPCPEPVEGSGHRRPTVNGVEGNGVAGDGFAKRLVAVEGVEGV